MRAAHPSPDNPRTGSATMRWLGPDDERLMRELLAVFGAAFGEAEAYCARPPASDYLRNCSGPDTSSRSPR